MNITKRWGEKSILQDAHQSLLGNLNSNFPRKDYAAKAKVMKKVRHMYVDVLHTPEPWEKFARQVKMNNKKRTAFQEEMSNAVAGWDAI